MEYYVVRKQQGLAGTEQLFWEVWWIVLFRSNAVGVLVAAFSVESSDCVVSVQRCSGVKIIKKVVSRSNCFSGNFIRWKFFEDPTFLDSKFFPGPVPLSRLTHHLDSSTETTLCSSCLSIDTPWYQRATYCYRGPIEQIDYFFFWESSTVLYWQGAPGLPISHRWSQVNRIPNHLSINRIHQE
jgi:hypothetical protein